MVAIIIPQHFMPMIINVVIAMKKPDYHVIPLRWIRQEKLHVQDVNVCMI